VFSHIQWLWLDNMWKDVRVHSTSQLQRKVEKSKRLFSIDEPVSLHSDSFVGQPVAEIWMWQALE